MSAVLDSVMGKQLTAWKTGGAHAIELGFEDGERVALTPIIDDEDDLAITIALTHDPPQPENAYTTLALRVENVYSHSVQVDNVSGALVCGVCDRENADLGEEACDG